MKGYIGLIYGVLIGVFLRELCPTKANAAWTGDTAATSICATYVTGNKLPLTNGIATQFGGASILGLDGGITNSSGVGIVVQSVKTNDSRNLVFNGTTNFLGAQAAATTILGTFSGTQNGTNVITSQSANYNILNSDYVVFLTGAHTATLPTAVGIPGKVFTVYCSSGGTNAILTTSSQTISSDSGSPTKWTNTAVGKFTTVISDNANWWIVGKN